VSGYQTQSADTSREVEERVMARWRSMTPTEKLAEIDDLCRGIDEVAAMGIRMRHRTADDLEVRLRLAALRIDRVLMITAMGWDPTAHGD
jgi:hypothetical protein